MESRLQEFLAKIKTSSVPYCKPLPARTVPLNPDRRAENIRLLRAFLSADQANMAKLLKLGSQSYYSTIECERTALDEKNARRIEEELGLPSGWFERNNADSLFLSPVELDLILELRRSDPKATQSLVSAVQAVRVAR